MASDRLESAVCFAFRLKTNVQSIVQLSNGSATPAASVAGTAAFTICRTGYSPTMSLVASSALDSKLA